MMMIPIWNLAEGSVRYTVTLIPQDIGWNNNYTITDTEKVFDLVHIPTISLTTTLDDVVSPDESKNTPLK